jgi:hypothetical protein
MKEENIYIFKIICIPGIDSPTPPVSSLGSPPSAGSAVATAATASTPRAKSRASAAPLRKFKAPRHPVIARTETSYLFGYLHFKVGVILTKFMD